MKRPILSIITVNYNNNEGLIKTLESIKRQSFNDYEHIIIDAASTDASVDSIRSYQKSTEHLSRWISEPDKGIYDGMNKGIEHARGEYLYFLNSGDCLIDDILIKVPLDGTQYIYGNIRMTNAQTYKDISYPAIPDLIYLSSHSLAHQSCFIHRTLFEHHQYDISLKIIADWAHCLQCIIFERCSYQYIPITIAEFDDSGASSDCSKLEEERINWLQTAFPPPLSKALLECRDLDRSGFRSVIPILSNTKRFKKRVKKFILFLYKIHSLFSKKHPPF